MCTEKLNFTWYTSLWTTNLCTSKIICTFARRSVRERAAPQQFERALLDRELIETSQDGVYLEDPVFRMWFNKK